MIKSKNVVKKLTTILFTLVAIFGVGLTNVNAETTDITEIKLTGDYDYGKVPAGILPAFNPGTTTENIFFGTGTAWAYFINETSVWSGFGSETPVAVNDGKTKYGYRFQVKTNSGYQLASDLKVIYNDEDVTSTVDVTRWPWGAYVTVDLGKAIGESPATYTVTFNSNGGTEIAPKEVVSGLKIKKPSTPTKDKYLFRGWYEDSTFSKEFDFNTPITSDMTLYAKWEAANSINEIRLAGDFQYGNVPVGTLPSFNPRTTTESISLGTGTAWAYFINETSVWSGFGSETPVAVNDGKTKYGYRFQVKTNSGYQLASDLKVIYNDEDVTSTVEVTRWPWGAYVTVDLGKAIETPVVYTITFISNDGTPVAPQNVNAGEKLAKPTPAPTKEGFTFDGWYEDSTFSKEFDFNTPITNSMTLYAKWTENKYTLTFNANGGSGTMEPIADLTGEHTLPANEFTAPTGKKFKGWSLTADGTIVTKVDMTENRTVYAIWENIPVVTYTLTFDANGGTGSMTAKTGLTGEYTLPANEFTAPTGKKFKGWSLTTDGAIVTKVDMTENRTVYAIWENIIYTVTFNSNSGTPVAPQNVNAGEKLAKPTPAPTKEGFTFDGWYEDSTFSKEFDFNTPITNSMTLYAKWTENKYTLTFNANGGSGTMEPIADLTGEHTLPANEFTAPTGKKFKGWSLTADGTIVTKVDMTENRTVYAIWENIPVVTYTLTFDANGGTGSMTAKTGLTGEYTLPANEFTAPTGKKFKGWSLTTDGAIVTKVDMTENRTVYAIWENIPVVTYTLTFDANGGTGSMTAKTGLTGEYTLPANEFTAPTGKKFKGWSLTTDGAIVTKVDMTENRTVYAIWENIPVVTYTLTFDANGGTGSMTAKTGLTGEYTLPANEFTAPTGKKFKGWSLTTDGAIVTKVDMTENRTVYAIWENIPVVTYTLTFDANGGTGSMTAKTGLTGEYTLPANEFTAPTGKKFKGWSLTTDGAIVTKVDMTENKTVYAIWKDIIYSYEFLESTGEQTIDGKANSFKIVIDADETKFVSLEIDGVLYEKDVDYTVKHGSTIIEFTSTGLAKLNALSKGEHNIRVTFTDEAINGKITVNTVNLPVNPQNPSMDNPKTYDGIFTYIAILVVSILGLITAVIIGKKRARIN